jgi:hypothetical protein
MQTARYRAAPAELGWMVIDGRTEQPVEIGSQLQVDLSEASAIATANLLNNFSRVPKVQLQRLRDVLINRPYPHFCLSEGNPQADGQERSRN